MSDRYSKYEGHTPGPWIAKALYGNNDSVRYQVFWQDGPSRVRRLDMWKSYSKADAALIADAPALLAENKRLRAALRTIALRCYETQKVPVPADAFSMRVTTIVKDAFALIGGVAQAALGEEP